MIGRMLFVLVAIAFSGCAAPRFSEAVRLTLVFPDEVVTEVIEYGYHELRAVTVSPAEFAGGDVISVKVTTVESLPTPEETVSSLVTINGKNLRVTHVRFVTNHLAQEFDDYFGQRWTYVDGPAPPKAEDGISTIHWLRGELFFVGSDRSLHFFERTPLGTRHWIRKAHPQSSTP